MKTREMPRQGEDLKQGVYRTDPNFIEGYIAPKYKIIGDLAADENNFLSPLYLTEKEDSLTCNWMDFYEVCRESQGEGYLWLNPPYGDIRAWAQKCANASMDGVKILFLVPAAVGSNWYRKYVEDFARVDLLNGRLVFDFLYPEDYMDRATAKKNIERAKEGLEPIFSPKAGKRNTDPYPKDLMLDVYDPAIPIEQRLARTVDWRCYL
jgi:phage N-6-adenine-methyltransferase